MKKWAPLSRRPSCAVRGCPLGGRFDLLAGLAVTDRNGPRLQALGDVADEIDIEQAVLKVGALHFDVVGKLEAPLEAAPGNASVQELPLFAVRLLFAAHREGLFLHVDVELVLAETGHGHGDPVLVVTQALDVVGRIAHPVAIKTRSAVQQIEQAVEANGRAIEGAEIKMSHHESSLRSDCGSLPAHQQQHAALGAKRWSRHTRLAACVAPSI